MDTSLPLKLGLSTLAAGTAGAGGFYGYKLLQDSDKVTVSKKLGEFLMSVDGSEDQSKWETRKTALSSVGEATLVDDLRNIKTRSAPALDWTHIRDWCQSQHSKTFEELEKSRIDNIDTYCTYRIEEKLGKGKLDTSKPKTDAVWTGAFSKLNQLDNSKLSKRMQEIKAKGSNDNAGADALKSMCSSSFTKPYRNDEEFDDVNKYCTADS
ncbi:hypothetical protein HF1_04920 [Mycoplasma haemofelis str. Langford 1]|uniref:Uncharacterized protein n=1 Tax=Mycoplasma haemofelis (strain Langford 1) TaxID=941640 RepID=E8ZH79_MYCHL|nr:hypothetical protein [Mycoplasma haemofelis]CBY92500.1 hypothetical protein HF1_04920 [Mycoplasma haemofelis str. Langford 1]